MFARKSVFKLISELLRPKMTFYMSTASYKSELKRQKAYHISKLSGWRFKIVALFTRYCASFLQSSKEGLKPCSDSLQARRLLQLVQHTRSNKQKG